MTSFFDLIKTRRSIRKYLPKPVEQEKIAKITNAALMSPASKRSNPWEFIVIQEKEMLGKLADCRQQGSQFLAESPLAILVIADTTKSDVWMEDAAIASIIMQLQAHDLGLGSCWIQIYGRQKEEQLSSESYIRSLLNIPEHFSILNILSIGYPNENKNPFDDEKLAIEKIHYETYN